MIVDRARRVRIEEPRGCQHQQQRPLDRRLRGKTGAELAVHHRRPQLRGQRTAEGAFREGRAEFPEAVDAVGRLVVDTGEQVESAHDVAGGFDGGLGRRLVPGLGDRSAALIAHAGVIGRELRGHDRDHRGTLGGERIRRDHLPAAVRRLPLQLHRGRLLLELEVVEPQWIRPPTEEECLGRSLAHRPAAADPKVDQGRLAFCVAVVAGVVVAGSQVRVEVEPCAVRSGHAELVGARFRHPQ